MPSKKFNNCIWCFQVIEDYATIENNIENVREEMATAYYWKKFLQDNSIFVNICITVCVCACVHEREREIWKEKHKILILQVL